MTPELYSDDNGNRVIIRHIGPPGRGLPAGGTTNQVLVKTGAADYQVGWTNPADDPNVVVSADNVVVDGELVLFSQDTGKVIKGSNVLITDLATTGQLNTKQDKEEGKGLSQEDFTTALKAKLEALGAAGYRGSFASLAAIEGHTFDPVAAPGDYCLIEVNAAVVQLVLWDDTNTEWAILSVEAATLTAEEIAVLLFDDGATWTNDDSLVFRPEHKALLDAHENLIQQATGTATAIVTYAAVSTNYIVQQYIRTVECVSGSFTVTLPTAVNQALDITIKNVGGGTILINTADGIQTIDGSTSISLTTVNESVTLRSTGAKWLII